MQFWVCWVMGVVMIEQDHGGVDHPLDPVLRLELHSYQCWRYCVLSELCAM